MRMLYAASGVPLRGAAFKEGRKNKNSMAIRRFIWHRGIGLSSFFHRGRRASIAVERARWR